MLMKGGGSCQAGDTRRYSTDTVAGEPGRSDPAASKCVSQKDKIFLLALDF